MIKKLLSSVLFLALLAAVPVQSQLTTMPTPMPAAGAGGGGDASAANQTTAIGILNTLALETTLTELLEDLRDENTPAIQNLDSNFNAVIDNIGSPVGATAGMVRGSVAQIDSVLTALPDAEGDLAIPRVDATGASWVRNATVTRELFAAASASGSSTVVDTAGYTMGMIHFTTSGTWDRQGTFLINQSIGSTSPFKPAVGALEVRQASGVPTQVWQHVDTQAVNIGAVVDRVRGYMINLMGFQALQLELDITSGTAGTIEFHVHLYSGGSGFNRELSLGTDSDIVPLIGGTPPLIQMIGGLGTSQTNAMRALLIPDEDDAHTSGDAGIVAMAIRNDDRATTFAGTTGDYSGIAVTEFGEIWPAHSGAAFFAITDTAIAAVSQNFSFGFTSKKVFISAPSSNGDGVCIDHGGGTAVCPASDTAGDDVLEPGESISIDEHAITSVSAISVSGTNTIVVRAFN